MLVTSFEDTDAFKLKIIDAQGNRIKTTSIDSSDKKSAYTAFHRLTFNIKKLLAKAPGGQSRLASYAAALYLIKEKYNVNDNNLQKIVEASEIDILDILQEQSEWFLLHDKMLSPGMYRIRHEKVLSSTLEEMARPNDRIRIEQDCYPVGNIFGIDVYEATHINTNQRVVITVGEIYR
jgi:hypothetical protein